MSRKNPTIAGMFMRASVYNPEVFGHVISMPKLNGLRCMYLPGDGFYSRQGVKWADAVLSHIKMPTTQHPIDGELYGHGMTLQEITEAVGVTRLEPGRDQYDIRFYAFDILKPGRALQRMLDLQDVYAYSRYTSTSLVEWKPCYNRIAVDELYRKYCAGGYEGQMLKSIFGEYVPQGDKQSRTVNLQKRKDFQDDEFLCVGVSISQEPRMEGLVGALRFKGEAGKEFEVGTGFTRKERIEWASKPPTGRTATVRYLYLSEDGIPQNTSLIGWREGV